MERDTNKDRGAGRVTGDKERWTGTEGQGQRDRDRRTGIGTQK